MLFRPVVLSAKSQLALFFAFSCVLFSLETNAQTRKTVVKEPAKKVAEKKVDTSRKSTKSTDKPSKESKPSKADLAKQAEQKRLEEARQKADEARAKAEAAREAERAAAARRAEDARRQAALEERRRREEIARQARERAVAFERGLKTETQENIANDDTEGEDLEVRRAAVNALGKRAGTVVVMEPQTGKILSIVNQEWGIRRSFKPCSTVKLVTAVAALNEKVIDDDGKIQSRRFPLNLDDALAHSNNSYFQVAGQSIGSERLISYARALGLGEPTGLNVENEAAGKLPYGNNNARIYSHGDDFEVTPLQLSVLVSEVSNGGKMVVPRIPKTRSEQTNFSGFMKKQVEIPQQNMQRVLPGMIGAVNYGTAKLAADDSLNIAGKTGSCIGQGSWLGLFASVAPVINPRLSVVVITRGSGERGKYAADVAGKIYKSLAHRFTDGKDNVAKIPLQMQPKQQVTAKGSQKLDSDEGEDSEEGDAAKAPPKKVEPKKAEEKKPLFEPIIIIDSSKMPTRPRIVKPE